MNQPLLAAHGIAKRYGRHCVLTDVTFELEKGNVSLSGANGAGKSTLIAILAGVSAPDAGTICIDGKDLARHRMTAQRRWRTSRTNRWHIPS